MGLTCSFVSVALRLTSDRDHEIYLDMAVVKLCAGHCWAVEVKRSAEPQRYGRRHRHRRPAYRRPNTGPNTLQLLVGAKAVGTAGLITGVVAAPAISSFVTGLGK